MSKVRVPFLDLPAQHRPIIDELVEAFRDAAMNAAFVGGPAVDSFESAFADYCGTRHAVGVANGTDALRLAYLAAGLGKGDEVIAPANTFIATTEAISQAGATVVLADIDPATRLLDVAAVENAVTARTRAIVAVHLYGHPAPMDDLRRIAEKHSLFLIEDAAQAHGARWKSERCGSLGDVATFSFYPGKNLGSCGEGGAITTNDEEIARKVRQLRDHGQAQKYHHDVEGYNARLHAIQARFLEIKLRRLDDWNAARRRNAALYSEVLEGIPKLFVPGTHPDAEPVWHLYVIETDGRDDLQKKLGEDGIQSGLHYPIPLHMQKAYERLPYRKGDFPHAERSAARLLTLPMFPELTQAQIELVGESIRQWAGSPAS